MPNFFLRLTPPRPTFAQDMTPEERTLMQAHGEYVRRFYDEGAVLAYGPVLDPAGSFGMAILDMPDHAAVVRFMEQDSTVLAGLNTYTITPMMVAGAQPARTS